MAFLFGDSFDHYATADFTALWNTGTIVIDAGTGRNSTNALKIVGASAVNTAKKIVAPSATSAGAMALIASAPTDPDHVIQVIGVVRAATVVYFNPQLVQVEHE